MIQLNQVLEFTDIARLLNYSRSTNIDLDPKEAGNHWARYAGKNTLRGVDYPFNVVYLKAGASSADFREAFSCCKRVQNAELVHAPSLKLTSLKTSKNDDVKILDTRSYLASFIYDELSGYTKRLRDEKPSHYINPNIQTPSGFTRKTPNPLLNFLLDNNLGGGYKEGTVAIVLAEAGQGKTYMCRHLASTIAEQKTGAIPIFIDSSQWKSMPVGDQRSLSKTILNCLHHYGCPVPWLTSHEDEFVAIALRLDLFKIIFDGFDEYLLSNRDVAQEEDVIDAIRNLAEETGSRILVTSRTSYWQASIDHEMDQRLRNSSRCIFYEIVPFEEQHARDYFIKRFDQDQVLVSSAVKLFRALATNAKDLVGRGFVLNLIADVISTARAKSEIQNNVPNAIDWLIRELCIRDRRRQELPFDAEQQFLILRTFAEEVASGAVPNSELLELCMELVQSVLDKNSRQKAIQSMVSHPILQLDGNSRKWHFREEQVKTYLLAHFLANERETSRVAKWILSPGEEQDLIQTVVEILMIGGDQSSAISSIRELIKSLKSHQSGRFAGSLALAGVEKLTPKGKSHIERTNCLTELCDQPLHALTLNGTISSYNLKGVKFTDCKFDHVTFINCEFDSETQFLNCVFMGGVAPIRCDGLGESDFSQGTSFDPLAQRWIDHVRIASGKRQYSENDLRNDIGILLDRFLSKGRIMLKTVHRSNLYRGAIRSSKFKDEIIDEFKRMLLDEHHISGASDVGYNIKSDHKDDVVFYGQNNSFTGQVERLFSHLKFKLLRDG